VAAAEDPVLSVWAGVDEATARQFFLHLHENSRGIIASWECSSYGNTWPLSNNETIAFLGRESIQNHNN
jgi:hypothetical protein